MLSLVYNTSRVTIEPIKASDLEPLFGIAAQPLFIEAIMDLYKGRFVNNAFVSPLYMRERHCALGTSYW